MKVKYHLSQEGRFIIDNYNLAKPFASFFPGIAGKYGIPMWVFYVNRGQAIISAGTKDKDHAIMEFFPANRAWQLVSSQGFRTFIKVIGSRDFSFYEPFHNGFTNLKYDIANQMRVNSGELGLGETNRTLGIETQVEYFTVPGENYAAMARIVTIGNISGPAKKIEVIDGLPQIVPYGTNNFFLKKMSRTIEAWMDVEFIQDKAAYYKLSIDPTDRPEVIHIKQGNFYLSFYTAGSGAAKIIKPICDPESVFGQVLDFSCPRNFISKLKYRAPKNEISKNKMPAGFSFLSLSLNKDEQIKIYTLIGNTRSKEILSSSISRIADAQYILNKKKENQGMIEELQKDIDTVSSSREFDLYARQTYLDNIMRGGYPQILKTASDSTVFYLYTRKHGDLERDYNKFLLDPTYLSQGNGNYRDVNQNRRLSVWFNPEIKEEDIVTFLNLIQADGYNPLVVKGINFTVKDISGLNKALAGVIRQKDILAAASILSKPFSPGELLLKLEEKGIKPKCSPEEFLNTILSFCLKQQDAEHAEGFWTDHWTYNLDLLEAYFGIYPENLKEIVFEKKTFTFYDNAETVKPRQEKYTLKDGRVRQLHSLHSDSAKKEMLKKRTEAHHLVRTQYGIGQVYQTTLANKLFCLLANKLASLDPFGCGIEMEADKPNWFDSLNGLPGLLGSSICETMELKRLVLFIRGAIESAKIESLSLAEEISDLLSRLNTALQDNKSNPANKDHKYWEDSSTLKENYRKLTRLGFSGKETERQAKEIVSILNNALAKVDAAIDKAYDEKTHLFYTYFINEVTEYQPLKEPFVKPTKFTQKRLPFFLESQVHALRITGSCAKATQLYQATRKSELFDDKLKMYKVTAPLKSMPEEIGRCRVFTPGWLENESIWLHMEYKYLLELLKCGLYTEFYQDFKNTLIPFQDPQRYGRNILENSSFLVSSAFPDKKLHGNGFVARLSGSTAEFLQMWLIMNTGIRPFFLNNKKELNIKLSPVLPSWLFKRKDKTYTFNFLSKIRVIYHNPKLKDTFGKNAAAVKKINFTDEKNNPVEILSDTIPSPYAHQIRSRSINQIDVYLE